MNLLHYRVLNLIINGIPSIPWKKSQSYSEDVVCFKPYYKWNTFNTHNGNRFEMVKTVLNLIINGIPSIPTIIANDGLYSMKTGFKPYYKWNTFNTDVF